MEGGLCPTTRKSISPDWQQSAGQFGEQEMQCALIKKSIKSPSEIICLASSFIISYCPGLHEQGDKQDLEDGAQTLKEAALHIHQQQAAGAESLEWPCCSNCLQPSQKRIRAENLFCRSLEERVDFCLSVVVNLADYVLFVLSLVWALLS
jgi:hypothetical protein